MSSGCRHRHLFAHLQQINVYFGVFIAGFFKNLWSDNFTPEIRNYALKSIRDLLLMIIELLTENTMVQVISSVQHNRTPLRDLVREYLSDENGTLYKFGYFGENTYQVDTNTVLLSWIIFCLIHGASGLKVLQKGVRCLTVARAIRVMTFTMTVLPNPNPTCNFTQPVDPLYVNLGGACNDLLYSGHVIVYTISALAVTILCSSYPYAILRVSVRLFIWTQVVQRIIRAVVELHHYSVDMLLGLWVTLLIWHANVLYYDLPCLPTPLYPHIKRLFYGKDPNNAFDKVADRWISMFSSLKQKLVKIFNWLFNRKSVSKTGKALSKEI